MFVSKTSSKYSDQVLCPGSLYKHITNGYIEYQNTEQLFEDPTNNGSEWESNPGDAVQCKAAQRTHTTLH